MTVPLRINFTSRSRPIHPARCGHFPSTVRLRNQINAKPRLSFIGPPAGRRGGRDDLRYYLEIAGNGGVRVRQPGLESQTTPQPGLCPDYRGLI